MVLRNTCIEISKRYEIRFLEIGAEGDHIHFLIQSVPTYSIGRLNWPNFSAQKLALKICSQSLILCGFQPVSKVPKNG